MKQKNLLTRMLLLFALIAGSVSAWAAEETITASQFGFTSNTNLTGDYATLSTTNFTLTFAQNESTTVPVYNSSSEEFRLYKISSGKTQGATITIASKSEDITFDKIVFNFTNLPTNYSFSAGSYDSGTKTWTGNSISSLTLTNTDFSGQLKIKSMTITYTVASSTNPTATLSTTSLDFEEVIFGETLAKTFTVTPANLTGNLSISCDNAKYEVSPTSIAQTTTTVTTITVTAKPTAIDDDMDGKITISGGGLVEDQTVALYTTVTAREGVSPVAPASTEGYYQLVSNASTLAEGDKLIIAYDRYALSTEQKTSNRAAVEITVNSDGTITANDNTQEILLEGETGAWYFNVGTDQYLYASSNSSNQLKTTTMEDAGDNGKATITIDSEGFATITFQGTNGRNTLRYNPNGNNQPLFACYAPTSTTGSLPLIYRYVPGAPANTIKVDIDATAGYKTLVSSVDFETPDGVTAYIVTAKTAEKATLTKVDQVPAGTPVILKGSGEVTLNVVENVAAISGNQLQVSDETTGNGVYVLANVEGEGNGVGFYQWTGGSLGAGRVYLDAPNAARTFLAFSFDDESTGIAEMEAVKNVENAKFYNLAGQRVALPTKGLYIVNGKKYIVK